MPGRLRFGGLWRDPGFLNLWVGQSISIIGSRVTALALPLAAVLTLGATPAQMGVLRTVQFAPFLLIGLFAGVWADRLPRRPLLIGADLGRALLLASIPLAALLGRLRIEQLYLVGFLVGILTVIFDVAYQSFLPALVQRAHLLEANSKTQLSESAGQLVGPGLAGVLVQAVTAPLALLADAASFLLSVLFLWRIHTAEPPVAPRGERRPIRAEIGEGLRVVLGDRRLRAVAGCTATLNLANNIGDTVLVLYATRELAIQPALLGALFALASVTFALGAALTGPITQRLGFGRTLILATLLITLRMLFIPLASGAPTRSVALLTLALLLGGFCGPLFNINQLSMRQAVTPDRMMGRVNATMRFLIWGVIPIGSMIGGALGGTIGLRATLLVSALATAPAVLWLVFSPLRAMRDAPMPLAEAVAG